MSDLEQKIVKLSVKRIQLERRFNALAGSWCGQTLNEQKRLQKEFAEVERNHKLVKASLEDAAREWVRIKKAERSE